EVNQQAFAFDETKRNVGQVRQSLLAIAVENDCIDARLNLPFKAIAQTRGVTVSLIQFLSREFSSRAKPDDIRNGFSSRPPLSFLMPADLLGKQTHAAADEQSTRSFGRIHFVR